MATLKDFDMSGAFWTGNAAVLAVRVSAYFLLTPSGEAGVGRAGVRRDGVLPGSTVREHSHFSIHGAKSSLVHSLPTTEFNSPHDLIRIEEPAIHTMARIKMNARNVP